MSNFSMISSQGAGFAAPSGFASDLLGFANRWQTAANAGRTNALDLQQDVYAANQNQMNLNNQGRDELIRDLTSSSQVYDAQRGNLEAQRQFYIAQCLANGGDQAQCRLSADIAVGRLQPETQTQGPQMSSAPNVGLNINSILGLN